jgi:outer membrane lipoprotein-sorting protein
MSVFNSRKIATRWIPAGIAAVVVAAGAIAVPISANAAASLTPRTAEQVLAMIGNSKVDAFSGKLSTVSNLGLPSLPTGAGGSSATSGVASILTLISSPQSARIYVDGTTKERVQVMSNLAEQDVIRNGNDVWQYDSKKNTASHTTLAPHGSDKAPAETTTPAQLAHELVSHLDPSTRLSVGSSQQVAGRNTYTLVLTPKATDTLIGSVSISVDSATGLPLAVDVSARGQKDPALGVSFTSIDLSKPAASLFTFTPPKGAKVTTKAAPAHHSGTTQHSGTAKPATGTKPTVVGTGWDAVAETAASTSTSALTSQKLFTELTTAVSGGRVLHTSLVNVLVTTDGRVLAGSVPVSRLSELAAAQK